MGRSQAPPVRSSTARPTLARRIAHEDAGAVRWLAMPEWVFDVLPPSGARRGGDPAAHAFARNLDTFVREVVQNANDQRIGDRAPEVHFRFRELSGDALRAFCAKIAWPTLLPHLESAGATRGGRAVGRFLAELGRTGRMLVLTIEDRHTVGLTGDEFDEDSHFRALCKDTLYSHKRHTGAGGSYGLGKSVLWSFSALSTVLFNSVLDGDPRGKKSPRLIGRTELPSHRTDGRWYGGSGWFGTAVAAPGGRRAESVWSLEAALEARDLHLERAERATGTSILIVGFRDPTFEEEPSVDQLHESIRTAAARWFWPAMELASPGLRITSGDVDASAEVDAARTFAEAWRGRDSTRTTLEQPGDVVSRSIPIEVPPPREGGGRATRGEARLIVRLAPETSRHPLNGHVAMFRKPGMVVRYWDRSGVAQGMRPFHAILAAGEARDPAHVTDADRIVERFLRDAEPPGHDLWHPTPALKETWKIGYAKAIKQLEDRVTHELRELLTPAPSHGTRGPERLQKRFPIGRRGDSEGEPSAFRFSGLDARFDGERWSFSGAVSPLRRVHGPWEAIVSLNELGDGGTRLDRIAIAEIECETEGAEVRVVDRVAHVEAAAAVDQVAFRGRSTPVRGVDGVVTEIELEVGGRLALTEAR